MSAIALPAPVGGTLWARALFGLWRIGIRQVFAYRGDVVLQLLSAFLVALLNVSLWSAAVSGREQIAGVPAAEMLSYVVVAWVGSTAVRTRVHEEIGHRFRDGRIVADLLRPLPLQASVYARDLGRACGLLLVQAVPLLAVCALIFPVALPSRPETWLLWLGALWLAHLVNFGLSFLLGLAAFRLHDITGLSYLKATFVSIFSGAMIPLSLFEGLARTVVFALPFHAIAYAPAVVLLEWEGSVGSVFAVQAVWALGLWVAGAVGWWWAGRALTVQGG